MSTLQDDFPDEWSPPAPAAIRGRGAAENPTNRFERLAYVPEPETEDLDEDLPALPRTVYLRDPTRTVLARNNSPDVNFGTSLNPYRGCEHGCVYCYARPTHEYLDLSLGQDFESKLFFKPNALELLEKFLNNPRYRCETIALGTNTDPYQPLEKEKRTTRGIR